MKVINGTGRWFPYSRPTITAAQQTVPAAHLLCVNHLTRVVDFPVAVLYVLHVSLQVEGGR
jgi:hypothetical protein